MASASSGPGESTPLLEADRKAREAAFSIGEPPAVSWFESILGFRETLAKGALIAIGSAASYALGRAGYSAGWVVLVFFGLYQIFRRQTDREIRKAKEFTRQEVTQALFAHKASLKEEETLAWFNEFFGKYWLDFQPWLSDTIKTYVNDTLIDYYLPNFLDSFQLTEFDLGSTAPYILGARFNPNVTESDIVELIFHVRFTPLTDADMKLKRMRRGYDVRNARVVATARMKGVKGIPLPVQIDNLELEGFFAAKLVIGHSFPHVKSINVWCPDRVMPKTDYSVRPLKGADLLDMPGMDKFVRNLVDSVLDSMFAPPIGFYYNIEALWAPVNEIKADLSVGVLRVSVRNARDLRNRDSVHVLSKLLKDKSDPYVRAMLGPRGRRKEICVTKTIESSLSPRWSEVFYVLIQRETLTAIDNGSDILSFEIRDRDEVGAHPYLGDTDELRLAEWLQLRDFKVSPTQRDISEDRKKELFEEWGSPALTDDRWKPLYHHDDPSKREAGELKIDLAFFPVTEFELERKAAEKVPGADAEKAKEAAPVIEKNDMKIKTGVVRVIVHQCKDVGPKSGTNAENFEPYISAREQRSGREFWRSKTKKRTNNPVFYETCEFFTENVDEAKVTFQVRSTDGPIDLKVPGALGDREFGAITVTVKEALKKQAAGDEDWYPLAGDSNGKIRLEFRYLSIDMPPVLEDTDGLDAGEKVKLDTASVSARDALDPYAAGRIDVTVVSARQLPAADSNGKSDPYVQCQLNGEKVHNTRVIDDSLSPIWEDHFSLDIVSVLDSNLQLAVKDHNTLGAKPVLGKAQVDLADLYGKPNEEVEREYSLALGDKDFKGGFITIRLKFIPKKERPPAPTPTPAPAPAPAALAGGAPGAPVAKPAAVPTAASAAAPPATTSGDRAIPVPVASAPPAVAPAAGYSERAKVPVRGRLRVELLHGKGLPAVDRNGKSDPYVEFMLEDKEVGKSEVIKDTLDPVWNQRFEIDIPDIKRSSLSIKVKDHDLLKRRVLGVARIDLVHLDTDPKKEVTLPLEAGDKVEGGEITLRYSFTSQP